jgi:hypothetical protein
MPNGKTKRRRSSSGSSVNQLVKKMKNVNLKRRRSSSRSPSKAKKYKKGSSSSSRSSGSSKRSSRSGSSRSSKRSSRSGRYRDLLEDIKEEYLDIRKELFNFYEWYSSHLEDYLELDEEEQEYLEDQFDDLIEAKIFELQDATYPRSKFESIVEDIDEKLEKVRVKKEYLRKYKEYKKEIRQMYEDLFNKYNPKVETFVYQ